VRGIARGRPQRVIHASDDSRLAMGDYFDAVADAYGKPRPERISRAAAESILDAPLLSFMRESRRLRNDRLKHEFGYQLLYPTVADFLKTVRPDVKPAAA
jgi:nucleoside-diphosphate-sugar epimerase